MRILIISLPRTGSTSLLHKISKEKNLKPFFEPFDGSNRVKYNNNNNSVVKTIICHHPNNLELIGKFDDVILLNRRDLNELIESHSYQTYFSKIRGYNFNNPYIYEKPPEEIYNICTSDVLNWNEQMKHLSEITNIPITYYEDIFDKKSYERLRIGDIDNNLKKII